MARPYWEINTGSSYYDPGSEQWVTENKTADWAKPYVQSDGSYKGYNQLKSEGMWDPTNANMQRYFDALSNTGSSNMRQSGSAGDWRTNLGARNTLFSRLGLTTADVLRNPVLGFGDPREAFGDFFDADSYGGVEAARAAQVKRAEDSSGFLDTAGGFIEGWGKNFVLPTLAVATGVNAIGGALGGAGAAGGATGATGAAAMPAAIPETAGTLADWGLSQTAPGVFTNAGNAAAFGASLGAPAAGAMESAALSSGVPGTTGATGAQGATLEGPLVGPETGTIQNAPQIGSVGGPTVSGVASGAGPFVPVVGGATGVSNAVSGGLDTIMSNPLATSTLANLARGLPGAAGAVGANRQAQAYERLANQYMAMGAPYRSRLSELYNNPEDFLESDEVLIPIQNATNVLARSLSTKGNPIGSGNALQQLQNYASQELYRRLGEEKDRLAGFGGLTSYNAAAPGAATNAIGAKKGVYDAFGGMAADILNPPQKKISLQDLLKLIQ